MLDNFWKTIGVLAGILMVGCLLLNNGPTDSRTGEEMRLDRLQRERAVAREAEAQEMQDLMRVIAREQR